MINTERLEEYLPLLGVGKLLEMWQTYYSETLSGLNSQVSRWILLEDKALLRNFFHSRRAGALTFGMTVFAAKCLETEEHLLADGETGFLSSRLAGITALFEEEAQAVETYLKEQKHD